MAREAGDRTGVGVVRQLQQLVVSGRVDAVRPEMELSPQQRILSSNTAPGHQGNALDEIGIMRKRLLNNMWRGSRGIITVNFTITGKLGSGIT